MKKLILSTLLLCTAVLHAETVKIGVILPLSGNNANMGQPQLMGIQMVEEELAARTDLKHSYEFMVQDDELMPRRTISAVQQFINVDKAKAIVSFSSGCGNAVSPLTQRAKIIHIANCASDGNVANGSYNHTNWTRPEAEAELFLKYAQKRGATKIAFITLRQQGAQAIVDATQAILKENGIPSKSYEFNPNERDFRGLLYKVQDYKPDLIVLESFPPCTEITMRQYEQLGMTIPVTSIETFDYADDKSLLEGLSFVAGAAATKDFQAKIEAKFPGKIYTFAPLIYDSLNLLVEAFESSDSADIDEALAALHTVKDRPSAVGSITVAEDGVIHSPAGLYRMINGEATPIEMDDLKPIN